MSNSMPKISRRQAWAVGHFKEKDGEFVLRTLGIYSEGAATLTLTFGNDVFAADLFHVSGRSYEEAKGYALATVKTVFPQLIRYLSEADQEEINESTSTEEEETS